jgi:hypothetical protein
MIVLKEFRIVKEDIKTELGTKVKNGWKKWLAKNILKPQSFNISNLRE